MDDDLWHSIPLKKGVMKKKHDLIPVGKYTGKLPIPYLRGTGKNG